MDCCWSGTTAKRAQSPTRIRRAHNNPEAQLLARLKTVLAEADTVLSNIQEDELDESRRIMDSDTTVMKAIYHVVEHFSMHTGQIQWIAKSQLGSR